MKNWIQLILILFFPLIGLCQTGPGGVGTTGGTSSLEIWLDASNEASITLSGSSVTQWNDISGNGNHFTPTTSTSPTFTSGSGQVVFSDSPMKLGSKISFPERLFFVTNVRSPYGNVSLLYFGDQSANAKRFNFSYNANDYRFATDGGGLLPSPAVGGTIMEIDYGGNGNPLTAIDFILDGASSTKAQWWGNNINMNLNSTDSFRLGRNHASHLLEADFKEMICFDTDINQAQQIIIRNYLAAKYASTLSKFDIFNEDDAGNGNYDHDVAGIGRVDASNIHNDAQGSGIVRILNPTNLGNNEFLIWGHDNGEQRAKDTTDVPSSVQERFERTWRVSEVDTQGSAVNVGAIDIRFDLSDFTSVTASHLRLLVDTDNNGAFNNETPISGATSLGGNIYQFAGVTAIANNLRFTLGTTDTNQTPLPVELLSFDAELMDNQHVKLNWQTASEINNDFFTIERSSNGNNWQEVNKIKGAGNSSSRLRYSEIDYNPYNGLSFYRLKQTDFDGQFEYSKIISTHIKNNEKSQVKIYPNPSNNQIILEGSPSELEEIEIYNSLGQNMTLLTNPISTSGSQSVIDMSNLNTGFYYLKTKTTTNKFYKQ